MYILYVIEAIVTRFYLPGYLLQPVGNFLFTSIYHRKQFQVIVNLLRCRFHCEANEMTNWLLLSLLEKQ